MRVQIRARAPSNVKLKFTPGIPGQRLELRLNGTVLEYRYLNPDTAWAPVSGGDIDTLFSGYRQDAIDDATSASSASATLAQKWATQITPEVVAGQGYGAKKYAQDAAASASAAQTAAGSIDVSAFVKKDGTTAFTGKQAGVAPVDADPAGTLVTLGYAGGTFVRKDGTTAFTAKQRGVAPVDGDPAGTLVTLGYAGGTYVRQDGTTAFTAKQAGVAPLPTDGAGNLVTLGYVNSNPLGRFTRAALTALSIAAPIAAVQTSGYATAGDGGAVLYTRLGAAPTPSKPWHFQSVDGAWWSMAEEEVNPRQFGAAADGVTDDLAKVQACYDYLAARGRGGTVVINGDFSISAQISVTSGCITRGQGRMPFVVQSTAFRGGRIRQTSATSDVFNVTTTEPVAFYNLTLDNAGVTKTAGAGIRCQPQANMSGSVAIVQRGVVVQDCLFNGMFVGIQLTQSINYNVRGCEFIDFRNRGLYHLLTAGVVDAGDSLIEGNLFWCLNTQTVAEAAIRLDPAAAVHVIGNKTLGANYAVLLSVSQGPTGTLIVGNNSFEEYAVNGVMVQGTVGKSFGMLNVHNNQLQTGYAGAQAAINVTNNGSSNYIDKVKIHNNIIQHHGQSAGSPAISAQTGSYVEIDQNSISMGSVSGSYAITVGGMCSSSWVTDNLSSGLGANKYAGGLLTTTYVRDTQGLPAAQLGNWANGSQVYVTDGQSTSSSNMTVIGGGSGMMAFRQRGAWFTPGLATG